LIVPPANGEPVSLIDAIEDAAAPGQLSPVTRSASSDDVSPCARPGYAGTNRVIGGQRMANAIEVLTKEHRQAEQMMQQLKGTQGADATLLQKAGTELRIHMKIEEDVLYPFIRDNIPNGQELMKEAEKEHQEARDALAKVEQTAGTPQFEQALTKLEQGVNHHVQEEENEIFPKLRQHVDQGKLETFGRELEEEHTRLEEQGFSGTSDGKTRDELYAEAKEIGIEGRSKMKKDELAEAVEQQS
jgi:iron-sulfur cluster repair protein YtfE (RIC family)